MNEEANNQPQQPTAISNRELVVQPSASIIQELETQKQQAASQSLPSTTNTYPSSGRTTYPEPIKSIDQNNLNASQRFALASTEMRTKESDRPVSLRVKSLLVVAIFSTLAAAYGLFASFADSYSGSLGTVIAIVSLIQFGMSVYLFIGKDHNTVALILKIYLIFQLISLFLSFANPTLLTINGAVVLFLFYVYTRVKSLSYY